MSKMLKNQDFNDFEPKLLTDLKYEKNRKKSATKKNLTHFPMLQIYHVFYTSYTHF